MIREDMYVCLGCGSFRVFGHLEFLRHLKTAHNLSELTVIQSSVISVVQSGLGKATMQMLLIGDDKMVAVQITKELFSSEDFEIELCPFCDKKMVLLVDNVTGQGKICHVEQSACIGPEPVSEIGEPLENLVKKYNTRPATERVLKRIENILGD